jgi:hypothetical protein
MTLNEDLIKKLIKLLARPRTVVELMEGTGALRRTIYRYLTALESRGVKVVRDGIRRPTKYVVSRG